MRETVTWGIILGSVGSIKPFQLLFQHHFRLGMLHSQNKLGFSNPTAIFLMRKLNKRWALQLASFDALRRILITSTIAVCIQLVHKSKYKCKCV
jgi:hypothetical protein